MSKRKTTPTVQQTEPTPHAVTMYSVELPFIAEGIHARRGDILAVRPSHPDLPLLVLRNTRGFPLRSTTQLPEADTKRLVLGLLGAQVLAFMHRSVMTS